MGDHKNLITKLQSKSQKFLNSPMAKKPFRVITITLLSLLLPLSFLLLARLSFSRFLLTLTNGNFSKTSHFFSILLYFLLSAITISTLVHNLTGKLTLLTVDDHRPINLHRPIPVRASWIFLCALQVCVGLGIEGTTVEFSASVAEPSGRALVSRAVFAVGVHETMLHWCRVVVEPVVDDTLFGVVLGAAERWALRGSLAGAFGGLWWWRLREEVEALVVVGEVKGEMLMEVGLGDFVGWWLYYLTVTVGMVSVVNGLIWVVMSLFSRRFNGGILHFDHDEKAMILSNDDAC